MRVVPRGRRPTAGRAGGRCRLAAGRSYAPGRLRTGSEPDVRFTFANERTFLAWNRTALALIATGVAATQLLPKFDVEFGRRLLGLPLIALGAVLAVTSYRYWQQNQGALRRGEPLPRSPMPLVFSIGIGVVAIIAVILGAFEN